MKLFDYLVYNYVSNERQRKLKKKSKDCLFIRYSETTNKIYKIFDSSRWSANTFIKAVARNLRINKKVFPSFKLLRSSSPNLLSVEYVQDTLILIPIMTVKPKLIPRDIYIKILPLISMQGIKANK